MSIPRTLRDAASAFQFLTRVPLPRFRYDPEALSRSAKFFPLVGLAIGLASALVFLGLSSHIPAAIAALSAVLFTVIVTGGLHEDGLADTADAFGGGWRREQILEILKDSRIGSYGATAVAISILSRTLLIAALPHALAIQYLVAAHVLNRWTVLPLGSILPAAREDSGQGARLARQISIPSLVIGSLLAIAISAYMLRTSALTPILAVLGVTLLSGLYYQRRIGGVTGDCFGATTQLTEIAVYFVGVWHA
jgi:adenosylcobinamide-GDP ribazoletransferase